MKLLIFLFILVGLGANSFAQSQCLDIFSTSQSLDSRLAVIQAQSDKLNDAKLSQYIREGFLADAARRATALHQVNLAYRIEGYLLEALKTDTVVGLPRYLKEGSTEVYLVKFASGVSAIFKPDPEFWVIDSKKSNRYLSNSNAEVATYELSRIFGMQTIPITVRRQIDGKMGSLQVFVKGEQAIIYNEHLPSDVLEQAVDLYIFDYIIRNADRNEKNMLIDGPVLWGIDNGSSFHLQSVSAMTTKLKDLPIEQMSLAFLENLNATTPGIIRKVLENYPDQQVVEEIIIRHREVLREAFRRRTDASRISDK